MHNILVLDNGNSPSDDQLDDFLDRPDVTLSYYIDGDDENKFSYTLNSYQKMVILKNMENDEPFERRTIGIKLPDRYDHNLPHTIQITLTIDSLKLF